MKFILNRDKLTLEGDKETNSGSVNYYEADIEYDNSWDDLHKEAVFVLKEGGTIPDEGKGVAEIGTKIYIDKELWGSYAIGFRGYTIEYFQTQDVEVNTNKKYYVLENDVYVYVQVPRNEDIGTYYEVIKTYQISTNFASKYFNQGAGQTKTENEILKPTEWQVYVAQIQNIANEARASADEAQTSADNAENSAENAQNAAETATEQAETATEQAEEATRQAESAKNDADRAEQAREGFETEVENATRDFNTNATNKTNAFNENANTKTTEYNTNHTNKLKDYNDNATEKFGAYNTNHTNKLKTYNDNHTEKLGDYNTNATNKTKDYNDNATERTNTFNTNATNKTNAFNENATNKTTTFNENAEQKTTDFNDNVEDKTTEFNEVVDTAKDDIEEIAPKLQEKMAKIPSMMKDATATGTSIHTTDSALWYGKLDFEGFSRQETTTGANKLSFTERSNIGGQSEVDYVCNSQGQVTMTGTAVKNVGFTYNQDPIILNAGTYRIKVIGTYTGVLFTRTNPSGSISLNSNGEKTITIEEDNTEFKIVCNTQIGTTYNCDFYITLTPGETATTERYTGGIPKPNIDYPSEIRNLTGDVGIKRVGKNLFNQDEVSFASGILDDNGNPVSSSTSHYTQNFYKVIPNNTYSLSGTLQKSSSNDAYRIYFYDGSKNWISRTNTITSPTYTFVIPENCHYIRIQVLASLTLKTDDVQLENGLVTDYEAYKEKTITFPLGTEKMYQGSTLTDSGIKHIRKQIVLDGTENWRLQSANSGQFLLESITGMTANPIICNYFGYKLTYQTTGKPYLRPGVGKLFAEIGTGMLPEVTVEAWKSWLADKYANNNPVIIEFTLDEPETVPYTQAQQEAYDELQNLETYQYVNNIELIANEETNMTLDYKKDIQMQIAERDTEIENIKSRLALLE